MAKYNIIFSCGHEGTVELFGKNAEREKKIEWYKRQDCPECRKKQSAEEAAHLGLPELTGSEKQIAFANALRTSYIAAHKNDVAKAKDGMSKQPSADKIAEMAKKHNMTPDEFIKGVYKANSCYEAYVAIAETNAGTIIDVLKK